MLLRRTIQLLSIVGHAAAQKTPSQFSDQSRSFDILNQARTDVGVQMLAWSPDLAAYAQYWANEMATDRQPFAHATGPYRPQQGETLYEQQSGQCHISYDTPLETAIRAWIGQAALYDGHPVTTGREPWLHWSQCVWSGSTQVGCASAYSISTPYTVYIVCRFFPEGNV
ncbi:Pathogenesis-related protein 1B [Cladobotryum mycophilum]|uniref:Pathogenesis-related protein 1B n=1 Tax=Cladobotryum mycophilum TaxID=491253 RepID=A0ABR0SF50_9HYPO